MKHLRNVKNGLVLLAAVAAMIGGCAKKPDEMSMLRQQNQALTDDMNNLQNELAAAKAARDGCQGDLLSARNESDSLRNQLASRPNESIAQPTSVPPGWTAVPGGAMIAIEGSVLFDSGKVKLKGEASRVLDSVASAIQGQYGSKDVMVFGHTDDTPIKKSGFKDNRELSVERASEVVRHLEKRGIDPKQLIACGCGEYRPRVANDSKTSRSQNRRVEIFVLDAETRTAGR